jgi:hypothetical protein
MSFAITNSKNVVVKNWSVIQPQFWASIVINSTDVLYKDYYVNATQYNPEGTGAFLSWLQNTDGCDTYRSHNVTFGGSLTLPTFLNGSPLRTSSVRLVRADDRKHGLPRRRRLPRFETQFINDHR